MQPQLRQHDEATENYDWAPSGEWLTPGRFALVFGLLIFAAFPQVVVGLQTFVVRDFGFFAYPLAHFQRECFWRGELPLWNPYNNCGVPFLAQWNTMPLYPPALIYLLLPLSWSLSFFCLLHLFWAGLGMYFLAHRWTGNRLAAAVAGLVFAFNGFSLNLLMWPSHIATLSWMPWVVLFVERAWQEGGRKLIVGAVFSVLQMLAGGPETILLTWLVLSVLWLAQFVEAIFRRGGVRPSPGAAASGLPAAPGESDAQELIDPAAPEDGRTRQNRGRTLLAQFWRFPAVVVLVAALAAVQLAPFLDLAAHSQREQGYADTRWSMPTWGWANLLVPMVFGRVWNMGLFFQQSQAWTSSYYLGVGVLLLAAMALWTSRQWRVWLLGSATAVAFLLAMGDQGIVYRALRHIVPQMGLMTYPVKFLILVTFAMPLLAAFGFAQWQGRSSQEARSFDRLLLLVGGALLLLIVCILFWARLSPFPGDDYGATLRNGLSRAGLLVIATLLLVALRPSGRKPQAAPLPEGEGKGEGEKCVGTVPGGASFAWLQPFLPLLLLLLSWVDVWTHEPNQNPTVPTFVYEPGLARAKLAMQPQPEIFQSRAMLTPAAAQKFREFAVSSPKDNFLVKRFGYFADCNLLDEVPKVDGFFSLAPRQSGDLLSALYGSTNLVLTRLADFMAVSQISAPGEFPRWEARANFLPLVTAGQRPFYFDDAGMLSAVFSTNFDASKVVCLLKEAQPLIGITNQTSARIISSRFQNKRVEVEVEAAAPSMLVVSQTYYHPWRAYVDARSTPLLRANYAFQAIQVPGGRHQVRLVYEDRAFQSGASISALAVIGCLIGWCATGRKAPNTKFQAPEKLHAPSSKSRAS